MIADLSSETMEARIQWNLAGKSQATIFLNHLFIYLNDREWNREHKQREEQREGEADSAEQEAWIW